MSSIISDLKMADEDKSDERELIEFYFNRGYQYKHIVLMLDKQHGKKMNLRTLQRRLKDYGLSRRESFDEDLVRSLITREIESGPGSLHGYRSMWHVLRLRYQLNVPRRIVETLMKEIDPNGVRRRKQRCLKRRTYLSAGPNSAFQCLQTLTSLCACVREWLAKAIWLPVLLLQVFRLIFFQVVRIMLKNWIKFHSYDIRKNSSTIREPNSCLIHTELKADGVTKRVFGLMLHSAIFICISLKPLVFTRRSQ